MSDDEQNLGNVGDPKLPFFERLRRAGQVAESQVQFNVFFGRYPKEVVTAAQMIDEVNHLILDFTESKGVDNALVDDLEGFLGSGRVGDLDFQRLYRGLDAYSFGAGITSDLTPTEQEDARYYFENVYWPLMDRNRVYRNEEGKVNQVFKDRTDEFLRSAGLTGDS